MKKLLPIILCLTLLTGCSGGSVYSNYRELEQLTVIQSMGLDAQDNGDVLVSVSAGAKSSPGEGTFLSASAESITSARKKLSDYSSDEQLFFAHTSYIAVGERTARQGLKPYFDYIARVSDLRLDVPMFCVTGSTANALMSGASDATGVFRSLEQNSETRGDCVIFSVSEIVGALDINGCALMTAVRPEKSKNAVKSAGKKELSALPDGYAVIKHGAMVGRIPADCALGVGILTDKAGPAEIDVETDTAKLTLALDDCSCDISPVIENGALTAININVEMSTALTELDGSESIDAAEAALSRKIHGLVGAVLDASKSLSCDFLQLGTALERKAPRELRGLADSFSQKLGSVDFNINVNASIDRSFDLLMRFG